MTELEALSREACWRHLPTRVVGRIGFNMGRGPRIHPVNYQVDGETVVVRTAPDSELAKFAELFSEGARVAFEVDHIDYDWHRGWSVLLTGALTRVEPEEPEPGAMPRSWVGGQRDVVLRITPVELTGRAIRSPATV